jgi:uncharacterized membrane protein
MGPKYVPNKLNSHKHRKLEVRVNLTLMTICFLLPFLLVWVFWFASGLGFSTQAVFNSFAYWTWVVFYELTAFPYLTGLIWRPTKRAH